MRRKKIITEESKQIIGDLLSKERYLALEPRLNLDVEHYLKNRNILEAINLNTIRWQSQQNREFTRILVTANTSSGKSTLVNALLGLNVVATAQESKTAAVTQIIESYTGTRIINNENLIRAPFLMKKYTSNRLAVIDTPGVNDAQNPKYVKLTKEAILKNNYSYLVYVIGTPGSIEEFNYMRWIIKHVEHEKIIFVLNKIDNYQASEDNVISTLTKLKFDLEKIGYPNAIIYPMSAYAAYLIKRHEFANDLDNDELDEYEYLIKKFKRPQNNLSQTKVRNVKFLDLLSICGMLAFENKIRGELNYETSIH
ncbi:GTPase [Ligilactobacillus equi]|uniref:G domain-containing protein n=1 Tax=Ligilactobacillus equi DSM 15833 = JCM 10991 TaxID=1423740 RepID=A0A0R1TP04_9LACO|nr:GTPase [Ligilactobacillus equi]KRL83174.1 hypothetical protein FC36_GL000741 [Ligilactobacillus equi DSM 15833 = JCM 10991]